MAAMLWDYYYTSIYRQATLLDEGTSHNMLNLTRGLVVDYAIINMVIL